MVLRAFYFIDQSDSRSPTRSLTLAGLSWPVHGVRFSPLYPYVEAEARYACRHEYAMTATDFIARRIRLSFLNVQVTLEVLPRVIDIMAEELGWDNKRKEKEFDVAQEFLKSMGLPEVSLASIALAMNKSAVALPRMVKRGNERTRADIGLANQTDSRRCCKGFEECWTAWGGEIERRAIVCSSPVYTG